MVQFKICMIGSYAVGKTSLVEKFVRSLYSDEYHTTIGVKIDKKIVETDGTSSTCMIWDIAGEDEFYTVKASYLRGMSGFFLVVDGTRPATVATAAKIYARIQESFPTTPFLVLANKEDLTDEWQLPANMDAEFPTAITVLKSSAKTGNNVELAFTTLVKQMLAQRREST